MPPSSLIGNLNSDFIGAQNRMKPQNAPRKIVVYVESFDDISFWRNVLKAYESANLFFEIVTATSKGKSKVLAIGKEVLKINTGVNLIGCVDSDYDYLLQGHTPQSKHVNDNPYIFQTYTYAIENFLCFSESLHSVIVQATNNDVRLIDFDTLLIDYSRIIYRLFLWNIYFRKANDDVAFSFSDFCKLIILNGPIDILDNGVQLLQRVKVRVDAKVAELEALYTEALPDIDHIAVDLEALGVNERNTYLFIQGHTLKDNVVLMVLKPLNNHLVNMAIEQIKQNAAHRVQLINDVNHYRNSRISIDAALNLNTEFKNCFLFKKLQADLDRYINELGSI